MSEMAPEIDSTTPVGEHQPTSEELNPGSFNEFLERADSTYTNYEDAVDAYSEALWAYKQALARERGVTVEELHYNFGK